MKRVSIEWMSYGAISCGLMIPAVLSAAEEVTSGSDCRNPRNDDGNPNIIWIMTDQQWAGAMSCAGNGNLKTPAMDRIAAHGVRFVNAYSAMPLSGPCRSSMITGYMPSRTGMIENEMPLRDSLKTTTVGSLVEANGYDCVYAGKWHVNTISLPSEYAFGFHKIKDNGDRGLAESCVEWLRQRGSSHKLSKPFFMVASYTNPHNICEFARGQKTPHADITLSSPDERPQLPTNFDVASNDAKVLQFEKRQNYSLYPSMDYEDDDWRTYIDAYYRLVEAVDAEIGKILDEIDRQNLWENSVIIFTSDHGDGVGAHHWNQKTVLYEEVSNVPMIVCLPGGMHAGEVTERIVNNGPDLFATICDWAGVANLPERDGKSFRRSAEEGSYAYPCSNSVSCGTGGNGIDGLGKVDGSDGIETDYTVCETNFLQTGGTFGWMVRTPFYKYVIYDKGKYREQLYDMRNDRLEMNNLAVDPAYSSILEEHRKILRRWLLRQPAPDKARRLKISAAE